MAGLPSPYGVLGCELRQEIDRFEVRTGIRIEYKDYASLRRDAMVLHRWFELQCGVDGGGIDYDEKARKWYWINSYTGKRSHWVPDRETGARNRIASVCGRYSLSHYIQEDPTGAALYIDSSPLTKQNYSLAFIVA